MQPGKATSACRSVQLVGLLCACCHSCLSSTDTLQARLACLKRSYTLPTHSWFPCDLSDLQTVSRWQARPLQLDDWRGWFKDQAQLAGASTGSGLYVGLRLDGRVRASGKGMPPWQAFARQLPPLTGANGWAGFRDGFDGRVGEL